MSAQEEYPVEVDVDAAVSAALLPEVASPTVAGDGGGAAEVLTLIADEPEESPVSQPDVAQAESVSLVAPLQPPAAVTAEMAAGRPESGTPVEAVARGLDSVPLAAPVSPAGVVAAEMRASPTTASPQAAGSPVLPASHELDSVPLAAPVTPPEVVATEMAASTKGSPVDAAARELDSVPLAPPVESPQTVVATNMAMPPTSTGGDSPQAASPAQPAAHEMGSVPLAAPIAARTSLSAEMNASPTAGSPVLPVAHELGSVPLAAPVTPPGVVAAEMRAPSAVESPQAGSPVTPVAHEMGSVPLTAPLSSPGVVATEMAAPTKGSPVDAAARELDSVPLAPPVESPQTVVATNMMMPTAGDNPQAASPVHPATQEMDSVPLAAPVSPPAAVAAEMSAAPGKSPSPQGSPADPTARALDSVPLAAPVSPPAALSAEMNAPPKQQQQQQQTGGKAPLEKEPLPPNYVYAYHSEITPADMYRARLAMAGERKRARAAAAAAAAADPNGDAEQQQQRPRDADGESDFNQSYVESVAAQHKAERAAREEQKRQRKQEKLARSVPGMAPDGSSIAVRNMLSIGQQAVERRKSLNELEQERTQWRASHPHNQNTSYISFDNEGGRKVNADGEVEVEFLRGENTEFEVRNNRNNRMDNGSYSRYMLNLDPIMPSVDDVVDSFDGYVSIVGTRPRDAHQAMREDVRQKAAADERRDRDARYLRRTTYYNGTSTCSDLVHYYHFDGDGCESHGASLGDSQQQQQQPPSSPTVSRNVMAGSRSLNSTNASRGFSRSLGGIPHEKLSGTVNSWGAGTGMTRAYFRTLYKKDLAGSRNYNNALKREVELLDEDTYDELMAERARRRCDPHHGKADIQKTGGDYVYYNSKSKGFYVPRDPPLDALMLNYNHLYDFAGGTRFATDSHKYLDHTVGEDVIVAHRNPVARGPVPYPDSRGASWRAVRGGLGRPSGGRGAGRGSHGPGGRGRGRSATTGAGDAEETADAEDGGNLTGRVGRALQVSPRARERERIDRDGGHALSTARALDVRRDVRQTQCRNNPTIEDVLTRHADAYLARGRTTDSVAGVVELGKVERSEVPPQLMRAVERQKELNDTLRGDSGAAAAAAAGRLALSSSNGAGGGSARGGRVGGTAAGSSYGPNGTFNQSLPRTGAVPYTDRPARGLLGVVGGVQEQRRLSGNAGFSPNSTAGSTAAGGAAPETLPPIDQGRSPRVRGVGRGAGKGRPYEVSRLKYIRNFNATV